jgi:hypothetical protein
MLDINNERPERPLPKAPSSSTYSARTPARRPSPWLPSRQTELDHAFYHLANDSMDTNAKLRACALGSASPSPSSGGDHSVRALADSTRACAQVSARPSTAATHAAAHLLQRPEPLQRVRIQKQRTRPQPRSLAPFLFFASAAPPRLRQDRHRWPCSWLQESLHFSGSVQNTTYVKLSIIYFRCTAVLFLPSDREVEPLCNFSLPETCNLFST